MLRAAESAISYIDGQIGVLEYRGFRRRGPKGATPLEELLSQTGGTARGLEVVVTPIDWSIERQSFVSVIGVAMGVGFFIAIAALKALGATTVRTYGGDPGPVLAEAGRLGLKVIAVSDSRGGIINRDGLDAAAVQKHKPADGKRIWTVQVAAIGEKSAAESLAEKLRRLGYDAYVRLTKSETKTWHRVRVGQLESQKDAAELRNILGTKKEHKDAYIAVY